MPTESIEGYNLSSQQKRAWHLAQQGQNTYLSSCTLRFEEEFNETRFRKALQRIVARHEILRTSFQILAGMEAPVQVIADSCDLELPGAGEQRFDHAPLLRYSIESINPGAHRVTLRIPSLCADLASVRVLIAELQREYQSGESESAESSELMQYADYCQWQEDFPGTQEGRAAVAYWRKQKFEGGSNLRFAFEQPEAAGFKAAAYCIQLSSEASALLRRYSEENQIPQRVILATTFQVLLSRYCGHPVKWLGQVASGRRFAELAGAVGPYARVVPLISQFDLNTTFSALLRQNQFQMEQNEKAQDAFSNDLLSLKNGEIVYEAIFEEVSFVENGESGGLNFTVEDVQCCSEPFKIKLAAEISAAGVGLQFHYNSKSLAEADVIRMAHNFDVLINSALTQREIAVSHLSLISESERKQVLHEFNRTAIQFAGEQVIHAQFEHLAVSHPDQIAVQCGPHRLTYAELNHRANQLAHHLIRLGVGPEVPVAICMERSVEMLVGIVGILKAGGAYVPLDPSYPKERLAFVMDDTRTPVLITQPHLAVKLPEHQAKVVMLGAAHALLHSEPGENPVTSATGENLSYVIYTSGSTGKPKGVLITHRALINSTKARIHYYREPIQNYLLISSFSFDSSIAGIFWTLSQGGTVTLPEEGQHQDPAALARLIHSKKVSHFLSLPSLYAALLEFGASQLGSLKTVIVAGEACPRELPNRHFATLQNANLYNEYGPTESTVWSTVHHCTRSHEMRQIPIGKPIMNVQVYILDPARQPVPIGVIGEIYIGGSQLSRGYLNRAELNQEKFVGNPFQPGTRLYRTGDLARFNPDGTIEFLGRIDLQVKIRGFRIELGEIENLLLAQPNIQEAVVLAREDSPGDKRLVGYVVGRGGQVNVGEIKTTLQKCLPEYMVPNVIVALPKLPLTPNGKVDRKALPAPESTGSRRAYSAPQTEQEQKLARIWADVLKLERVGMNENFFELGGHSLLAIQVISRVRDQFQVEISLRNFFDRPTLEAMALELGKGRSVTPSAPIKRVSRTSSQPGVKFNDREIAAHAVSTQSS
ncbi:MAG: amino acid adenylation domain-containing protein [Verrucomicrobiota bacterium]|nr:amino acid adenylation domain-containing protein [Verrucomicrobiota bacterium]